MKLKKLSARFSCVFAVLAMGCGTVYAVLYADCSHRQARGV